MRLGPRKCTPDPGRICDVDDLADTNGIHRADRQSVRHGHVGTATAVPTTFRPTERRAGDVLPAASRQPAGMRHNRSSACRKATARLRTSGRSNDNGYVCIRWTVDTLGWKGTSGGITEAIVRQRVLDAAQPGEIVLMHFGANPDDGTTLDADALPEIITGLSAMGYSFVTLDAMLR